ncbi:hypothetical protein C6499_16860 [Candidatus Poribacteria bacterium]|nr:MAG: hypothetical protein C6499_16860 [Candidatus Poribacteria bacterium]
MISKFNWGYIFLKKNPFDLTPPVDSEQVIWAGMEGVKRQFDEIFKVAVSDSATQVVLNRGLYGGGKTHAAIYFASDKYLSSIPTSETPIHQINICAPKDPGKPAEDFYIDILDTLGMSYVHKIIRESVCQLSEAEAMKLLQTVLGSEELARAFWLFGTENTGEKQALLRAYFLEGCTRTELRKLGIARNISKSQDRFRVLAGVLQCLIGLNPSQEKSQHSRVCLWVDEIEDLIYLTSSQFRIVTQGLRDLIDRLPNFFTLFLNMTLADPEAYEEFNVILGGALLDRITDVIYFPELDLNEAVEYVSELINHPQYRDKSLLPEGLPETYPFDLTALEMLLEDLENKTPRNINKRCRNAIYAAFSDGHFEIGKSIIDSAYVMKLEQIELDREV